MSRGFVKEDDQEAVPLVPPRAPLPDGVTNLVTKTGMAALLQEKSDLISEKEGLRSSSEKENRIASNFINAKLQLLDARIASAVVVESESHSDNVVRFGATITLKIDGDSRVHTYRIVGVDEADISDGKISFISPIARAMINKTVGDHVAINLPAGEKVFELVAVNYF